MKKSVYERDIEMKREWGKREKEREYYSNTLNLQMKYFVAF